MVAWLWVFEEIMVMVETRGKKYSSLLSRCEASERMRAQLAFFFFPLWMVLPTFREVPISSM